MKLIPLGVNGPYPAPGGACSGYYLCSDSGETRLLLDCGAGVLARLTRFTDVSRLNGIVLSHLHYDHMSDMTVLRYYLQFNPPKRNLTVIAPEEPASVRALLEDDRLDLIRPESMTLGEMRLTFAPSVHPVPCVSVRVECDGRTFVYTGDTNRCADVELLADGADLLLADAGLTHTQWSEKAPHLSAKLCGELARSARCGALLLTHLRPGNDPELLLDEARQAFPTAELAKAGNGCLI